MRRRIFDLAAAILLLATLAPSSGAHAASKKVQRTVDVDVRHVEANKAAELKLD